MMRTDPHPVSAMYACEICGKEVSDVDVVSYGLVMRLPGKNPTIPAFQCSAEQHFGCTEEHAWQAVVQCRNEHLKPAHAQLHADAEKDKSLMEHVDYLRKTRNSRPVWRRG
jgi:hypothetical protein